MFQAAPEDTEGNLIYRFGNRHRDIPSLPQQLEEILPQSTTFHDSDVVPSLELLLGSRGTFSSRRFKLRVTFL